MLCTIKSGERRGKESEKFSKFIRNCINLRGHATRSEKFSILKEGPYAQPHIAG